MEIGKSKTVNTIMRFLSEEVKQNIEIFLRGISNQKYLQFHSVNDVNNVFSDKIDEFLSKLSEDELLDLKSYTGYNFKFINAILRDNWTYEDNGLLDQEKRVKFLKLAQNIKLILNKFPETDYNFITYRGTNLSAFSKYGINCIQDLIYLKDKYIYDEGFTSTSIIEDTSYYKKSFSSIVNNIEIKYIISAGYKYGALLLNNNLTYSLGQNEYLINKDSFSKVIDVDINENDNTAVLTVVVIPEKIWNYQMEKDESVERHL